MKITDALESVLRLLVSSDSEIAEPVADRPLPDWVKRVTDGHTVSPTPRSPVTAEPDEGPVEEQKVAGEADHLDQEQEEEPHHDEPVSPPLHAEAASEPAPAPIPVPPVAAVPAPALVVAEPAAEVSPAVEAPQKDFSHLESAADLAESLNLGFHLGSAVERIASGAAQGSEGVPALQEAAWLIERYIAIIENRPIGADLHLTAARLARAGDGIAGLKALAEALDRDAPPA